MTPDPEFVRAMVTRTHDMALSDAAAGRIAAMMAAMRRALDAAAAQSLFDTEPAHLHRALRRLAEEGGRRA